MRLYAPDEHTTAEMYDADEQTYHADDTALSFSQLQDFQESPDLFNRRHRLKELPKHTTDSMKLGSCIHLAVLEPEEFAKRVAVKSRDFGRCTAKTSRGASCSRNAESKDGFCTQHAKAAGVEIENGHDYVLNASQYQAVMAAVDAVNRNRTARDLIERCEHREQSMRAPFETQGNGRLMLRCRFDALSTMESIYVALKSTTDPSPRKFWKTVVQYGYDRSQAFYETIFESWRQQNGHGGRIGDNCLTLAVSSDPSKPLCYVYEIPRDRIEQCTWQNQCWIEELADRLRYDDWSDPIAEEVVTEGFPYEYARALD